MAAWTVARSMASFFTIALIGISLASAQSVAPSNATLPVGESGSETVLRLIGGPIFAQTVSYNIAPLTPSAGRGASPAAVAVSISKEPKPVHDRMLIESGAGN
jgi:hypothetical protein